MDFGELLDYAKKNEKPVKEVRCYRTTFAPPKKEQKNKSLSANIQKFLARKEEEERQKTIDADKKLEELLALRAQDSKANKRVRAMLKSTKAANKAAIDDARDDVNTAVTMAGPSQPDEDDYGYVSQEASAFYNKLMDKYVSTPSEDPKFSKKSQTVKDLVSTKDRVRMALLKEEEEESMPHKRKRRKAKEDSNEKEDGKICYDAPDRDVQGKESKGSYKDEPRERSEPEVKKKRPAAPPPINFADLLKIAAQKQFEPIKIEKKEPKDEDERPMTKKQKEEYLREKEYRMRKEEMARVAGAKAKEKSQRGNSSPQVQEESSTSSVSKLPSIPRIPKLNGAKSVSESNSRMSGSENEQPMRKREPQRSSSQDRTQYKQSMPEDDRPNNSTRLPDRSRPANSSRPVESARQTSGSRPPEGNRPINGSRPPEGSRPTNSSRPPEGSRPINSSRPSEGNRPVSSSRPSEGNRPVSSSRPSESNRPVSSSRPSEGSRPASSSRPTDSGRPITSSRPSSSSGDQDNRSDVRRNSLQQSNKVRESYQESKSSPTQTVPSLKDRKAAFEERKVSKEPLRTVVKEERKSSNPPPKPAMKDERSQMRPASKAVIKDERSLSSASQKPVIREDRKPSGNPMRPPAKEERPPIREERRAIPSECSRVPNKQAKTIAGANSSRGDLPQRGDGNNPKMSSNPSRRPEERPSKGATVSSSGNSLLKDRLSGPRDQNQASKASLSGNLQAKKEVRPNPPAQRPSNPGAPVKQAPGKPSANRPQQMGSQGSSRDPQRGPPPQDRRPVGRGEVRRPMMAPDRGPPGGRFLPSGRPRPQEMRRPAKRRIESDDEYDSELDDFIDDGPEEGEDYSKYIKEIFGYDKSRYTYVDEEDEDECMESNFAQQMKEEFVSTKLGIMEDLEDIKKEQMEKKKKKQIMMKKKRL
ncbi:protein SPT2 homolog [Ischnura elegans]|uniref:protein SPT2 homolog n=1 Tax=Ischnura elegans TaxID=197161 RepID=UPI001ED87799|nr:protein SPT2 homolog [Ischnura elegans]